tara:strand:- start:91 stop:996 length:906 start_codon:yes stop_codon:yes gene_type:complete
MITVNTPSGEFKVYTKKMGNNPSKKVLLLHGGPGATHEYLTIFDSCFPEKGIEYYYYDQLGSANSDQPNDTSLWNIDRFVEEVEQVRIALGLNKGNFYLYGQSWGGILAIEYALKYQLNLKGLIISNMMSSCPEYTKYVNETLGPQLPEGVFEEIKDLESKEDFENPRYFNLLLEHYYTAHVLRIPLDKWPNAINNDFDNTNNEIYVLMLGQSEFGIVGDAKLENWDRSKDISKISVPTLAIGGTFDTMDPKHMEWMASQFQVGKYLHCPNGSHLAMWDDSKIYFKGLIDFINRVDDGKVE